MKEEDYSSKWLDMLDASEIDLHPIQFANCIRLKRNDAVYIFDEVGAGKTISSGIMALDYLSSNADKEVLVITTNSLARYCPEYQGGQFKKDWLDKLPFRAKGFESKINIVNNHYSKFKSKKDYGFVIIDEAHLFLNRDTARYQNLINNVRAEKVVFLTATPIKSGVNDLHTYVEIAKSIVGKRNLPSDWIENINTKNKEWKEVICSIFDISSPVTRYFKDTIMALTTTGYEKRKAKRAEPCLWDYDNNKTKDDTLLENITHLLSENQNNRFVLFTRFVSKEAVKLGERLEKEGFLKSKIVHETVKSYYVVTGENAEELVHFTGTENLPTVLIMTYQISEQGVNLPGFNHVINYHISSFPSALEQRYGRIDRMGKKGNTFDKIYMCYLINKDRYDANTANFYQAVVTYVYSILSYLPSKNTLLSSEIIKRFVSEKVLADNYTERIINLCENNNEIEKVINYFSNLRSIEENNNSSDESLNGNNEVEMPETEYTNNELLSFCIDRVDCDFNDSNGDVIKSKLVRDIKSECREMRNLFNKGAKYLEDKDFEDIILDMQDKIMYCKHDWFQLQTSEAIDYKNGVSYMKAIDDCASFIASLERSNNEYTEFSKKFSEEVKIPLLFAKSRECLNIFYEEKFIKNDFNSIFPEFTKSSHRKVLEENNFKFDKLNEEESSLLMGSIDRLVETLPLFEMFSYFKGYLDSIAWRLRYDFNPFTFALGRLSEDKRLKVSEAFRNKYFSSYKSGTGYGDFFAKFFSLTQTDDKVVTASNWYKLAYHYSSRKKFPGCTGPVSLFYNFIYGYYGKRRVWTGRIGTSNMLHDFGGDHKVWINDVWTEGINNEVHEYMYGNN
ncbi:MAG: SNF2-related protein [Defluviitaleaceae bacterium]|nr:SNF2-related protein [Defluviitaleaceae bacterium]MCL2276212.1 SNF2-related protein [Defluviitaleaceae bacterium]